MTTIKPAQAQQIINIACRDWKDRLAKAWGIQIVKGEDIIVGQSLIQEMREAATYGSQKEVLREIFGKEEPKFKVGDWVVWSGQNPVTAQIVSQEKVDKNCWVLSLPSHNSCHEAHLRLATKEEIQKATYSDLEKQIKDLPEYRLHSNLGFLSMNIDREKISIDMPPANMEWSRDNMKLAMAICEKFRFYYRGDSDYGGDAGKFTLIKY